MRFKENRDGDPRFLQILINLGKRRSELLGLDAPIKTDNEHRLLPANETDRLRGLYERRVADRLKAVANLGRVIDVKDENAKQ